MSACICSSPTTLCMSSYTCSCHTTLYMCPHTTLYMCPHTALNVSSYYSILLYMCPDIFVLLILEYERAGSALCVLILLYMCVLILLYICVRIYVSSSQKLPYLGRNRANGCIRLPMLTYAHVCSRMLTYADVCGR
jgi:hypothetical protein